MPISLYPYQLKAVEKLRTGSILCGGVGSGKSRTALAYYFMKECKGNAEVNNKGFYSFMKNPKDLYIITTARKRDTLEWDKELIPFLMSKNSKLSPKSPNVIIDSWNNIKKYSKVYDSFFVFDEQRVIGSGVWVKSFLKIANKNHWIILSATPGDTWMDYVPIFVANKFYKNKTEFANRHIVYSRFSKYPKIDHYVEEGRLLKLKESITINMEYHKETIPHVTTIIVPYDKIDLKEVMVNRWNIYENRPIVSASELCYLLRKVVNSDPRRIEKVRELIKKHPKIIIFYNYNYELDLLRNLVRELEIPNGEWNGHKHEPIPKTKQWVYIVQYTAGAEGWNCVETNVIIFYSQNYSYKIMTQAAGRIDRLNSPFIDLYYYNLRSVAGIDVAILKSLKNKKNFNARSYADKASR